MKFIAGTCLFIALLSPNFAVAAGFQSEKVSASIEDNGNWQLTDLQSHVTWHGEWLFGHMMKVSGSDDSCFILGENEKGLVQLDCTNLKEISILIYYEHSNSN
ncbi:hypothetical protein H0W91_00515 [Patescibacteria group bacterium]|nr:hypothetical protein [Patescibacteria group bacterium]